MNKLRLATNIGKAVGAVGYGVNQTMRASGKIYRASKKAIVGGPRYAATVSDSDGVVVKEYERIPLMKVSELLTSIAHLENGYRMIIELSKEEGE
jgi:hypothetical protein